LLSWISEFVKMESTTITAVAVIISIGGIVALNNTIFKD
jgi:hypothetical protein